MKRIAILTVGTRGDVQPYVALAQGLQRAGYDARVVTAAKFAGFVSQHGVAHAPISAEHLDLVDTQEGKQAIAGKRSLGLVKKVMPMLRRMLDDAWAVLAEGTDAVVYHPKALAGYHIAEKLGVPGFLAIGIPAFSPTREFANPLVTTANLGPVLNKLSYSLVNALSTAPYRSMINRWRRDVLQLPPAGDETSLRGRPVARLYFYSRRVVPSPADWDAASVVTGYWFLERPVDWQPPSRLAAFLEAGPPPVYVGFGSMPSVDRERTTKLVLGALKRAGQRGVLAAGEGGLAVPADADADTVGAIDAAPHDWLFPRMSAVVHHGGAGTTAAGLRAGKPTVICPFFGDQPFWGRRVAALGAGPEPIPQKRLAADNLAQAIQLAATDDAMRRRAESVGGHIRAEDGVAAAVAEIARQL